ncbi:MAG TPA: TonB-dependent receptor [Bryobacteraceae bacterium]|nr:TonB-dependent receptor [Bryobacteraceae bacterium]
MKLRTVVTLLLLLVCVAGFVVAQSSTASISGTVLDPNGAVVPNAKVEAKEIATGRVYQTNATEAGLYVFPSLAPGGYTISVEQPGFKKLERTNIETRIGSRLSLDLRLEVGDIQQSVEVTAVAPLLEANTPERGQTVSPQFMNNLPLFTGGIRGGESFVTYMPGVNSGSEVSISGSGGRAKEILIDGASLTNPESGGVSFLFPAAEMFQEFRLLTGSYSSEYGRFGGGVELFLSKSGGNDLHGSAFLNMRRDIWNAAAWSVNQNTANPAGFRPKERINEQGGAAGGPVWIPKIYDGRNKTFWYFTFSQDSRPATLGFPAAATLPTSLMKQGIFTEVAQTIYDPNTTTTVDGVTTRQPFAGNVIPKSRWSKVATNMLPLIPDPTTSGISGNFTFVNTTQRSDYIWSTKFDHSITAANRVSFFMSRQDQRDAGITQFKGPLGQGLTVINQGENYRGNHDWVISPSMLLHSTFGFSRYKAMWDNPQQKGYGSKLGFNLSGDSDAFPRIQWVGADNLTPWGVQDGKVANGYQHNWTVQFNQSLSYTRGKHEFKLGWDIRRMATPAHDLAGSNGLYSFARAQTADPARLATTGNAFASFLLGATNSASGMATPVMDPQIRYAYHSVFLQDNFRVSPRLTLELGLRYEVPIGWHMPNGNYSSLDLNKPNPKAGGLPGALVFAGAGGGRIGSKMLYPTDWSNIGPRFGFAYRITDKTVLRGGFGIFYQALSNGGCGCTEGFTGSLSYTSDGLNPALQMDSGIGIPPGYQPPPFLDPSYGNGKQITRMGPSFGKAPRIYNWSFTLQHEYKNFLFEGAYVGNRGHGLNSSVELNQLPTSYLALGALLQRPISDPQVVALGYKKPYADFADSQPLAQALRPFPQFTSVVDLNAGVGKTWYDSLQTKIERRFGSWQLMGAYTFSKSLALGHYRQIFSQSQVYAQDAYNLADMKSYLPFDQTHVLNILNSYDLPFGKGKRYLSSIGRLSNLAIGGWTIAAAQRYYNGALIQVVAPSNTLGNGVLYARMKKANITGTSIRTGVDRTSLDPNNPNIRWFNSGANSPFVAPPQYALGDAALYYGDFRQPPIFVENVTVIKRLMFTESVMLEYRANAFNLFNRTNFGGVNGTVGNANFGRPTGAQLNPRAITMGLRLWF